ncbi:MAG: glycoside hydrolase family 15 protein [Methylocella sp.]
MQAPRASENDLDAWMARQYALSAKAMLSAISRTDLVKERCGFGRFVRPAKGSILASPVLASYDPDPDYFFHWLRDSAVIIEALRRLIASGDVPARMGLGIFRDFLSFSLLLSSLDGRAFLEKAGDFRSKVEPHFLQYVRPDSEIREIAGENVLGEPRFDPDGSLDILKWSRPQHDGPALRALNILKFCASVAAADADARALAKQLLLRDLAFTLERWRTPSFDIWEEELGRHYYTQLVQCEALAQGASWLETIGERVRAKECRAAAHEIETQLRDYWSEAQGFTRSRIGAEGASHEKDLDIAALLAVIHAGRGDGAHSVRDPKTFATATRLEDLFASLYKINAEAPRARAPAMGRYANDRYYSGGAYYFSTLGAAEFYYRAAAAHHGAAALHDADHAISFDALFRRGDMFMATVAAFTPESGDLSEQFDQATGAQTSAKNLAWSHAAFITACASRTEALRAIRSGGAAP